MMPPLGYNTVAGTGACIPLNGTVLFPASIFKRNSLTSADRDSGNGDSLDVCTPNGFPAPSAGGLLVLNGVGQTPIVPGTVTSCGLIVTGNNYSGPFFTGSNKSVMLSSARQATGNLVVTSVIGGRTLHNEDEIVSSQLETRSREDDIGAEIDSLKRVNFQNINDNSKMSSFSTAQDRVSFGEEETAQTMVRKTGKLKETVVDSDKVVTFRRAPNGIGFLQR
ncbi:unnamed protein product [Protopolystoma xenopodis]|uniref:Uncharacterized protein n=1 Tax=Protopolystoma xenopodis TaxID=117903 RepID=A0A448WUA0_9PLAT|nr:unnamed protein product [Protopolystoma xenopodis]